jgi:hypothetical protein
VAEKYPEIVSEFKALHEKWILACENLQ